MGLDKENEYVKRYEHSVVPLHTRSAKFGTVYVSHDGKTYDLELTDLLCGYVEELDKRNVYLTTAAERKAFLMEMYITHVLGLTYKDGFDLIKSNNVEDLTENTDYYRLMQQYTVYPIYDLYKLSWLDFINQSWKDIEFQLKMARQYNEGIAKMKNDMNNEETTVIVDERNKATIPERQFKRNF